MFKFNFIFLLLLLWHLTVFASIIEQSSDCLTNSLEKSFYCRGSRAMQNIIQNLNKINKPIVLLRGLEIVPSHNHDDDDDDDDDDGGGANSNNTNPELRTNDDSYLGRFAEYLRTHELNIKFSDLLADESEPYVKRDLEQPNNTSVGIANEAIEEARKKDKGQGVLLAMAVMFGKMMAVIGLGGIAALAMKALGIAMTALMMAGLIGLKSLSQHGHESSHSVQYVNADGHKRRRRRRRDTNIFNPLPLVYSGWKEKEQLMF